MTDTQTTISDIKIIYPAAEVFVLSFQHRLTAEQARIGSGVTQLVNPVPIHPPVSTCYMVAMYNGEVVGVATINRAEEMCELYRLYVLPEYRRHHVGATLVERVIFEMQSQGLKRMKVEAIHSSAPFWEKMAQRHRFADDSCLQNIIFIL
ncbi:GNAT family N-acetyltransferase [Gluconacetobacter sp.]|uniref:GNAT family N-acetyltransferase n=1 Tax=Gluconacetobacter sp. TaxID=1935994 RepID=UPI0039EAE0F1